MWYLPCFHSPKIMTSHKGTEERIRSHLLFRITLRRRTVGCCVAAGSGDFYLAVVADFWMVESFSFKIRDSYWGHDTPTAGDHFDCWDTFSRRCKRRYVWEDWIDECKIFIRFLILYEGSSFLLEMFHFESYFLLSLGIVSTLMICTILSQTEQYKATSTSHISSKSSQGTPLKQTEQILRRGSSAAVMIH